MLGAIGTVTGANNINIASLHVSRESMRGPALTVVNIDESPEQEHIAAIVGIDGVEAVRVVNLVSWMVSRIGSEAGRGAEQ